MDNYRVLFVDDEEELVTTLVERFEYRGIDADFALSGNEALVKMRQTPYDVVVVDLKMPGMSGAELMEILLKEYPKVPVLLITGHGSLDDEPEEKPEGAFDYLQKPINLEDMLAKIQEALRSR